MKNQKKTPRPREIKKSPWLEDYLDCFTFKLRPVTEAFIERISKELILWAKENEEAYILNQFFSKKGIPSSTYHSWKKKYQRFEVAYEFAKGIIGNRREYGALTRKLDPAMIKHMMPHYDPDWKEMFEFEANLRRQANEKQSGGTQFIVMPQFKSSNQVPEKPIKNLESKTPEEIASDVSMKKVIQQVENP